MGDGPLPGAVHNLTAARDWGIVRLLAVTGQSGTLFENGDCWVHRTWLRCISGFDSRRPLVSSGIRFCAAIGLQPDDFDFEAADS